VPKVCKEHRDVRSVSTKGPQFPSHLVHSGVGHQVSAPWGVMEVSCCSTEGTAVQLEARYGTVEEAVRKARQCVKEDKPQQAFLTYSLALDMDEDSAPLCDEFGQFLLSIGQLEGAECLFDRALTMDPLNPEYCYRRGVVLQQRRQLMAAVEAFTDALRQNPRFVGALFNRGIVHRELGDHNRASDDFRRIMQLDPGSHSAAALLGECLAELGDLDGAVQSLEEALRLDPTNRCARKDLLRLRESASYGSGGGLTISWAQ